MNEYLVLKNELNQSNKFPDQKTLLLFQIAEEASGRQVLFAKLSSDQKIRVCEKNQDFQWTGVCQHVHFVDFSIKVLNFYDVNKFQLKISFNEYFYIEFNKLLGFK